jgi:hypothetical protein
LADAFPISGSIDPKAFPYLLMDLHRHGATGSLKVEGPSYQKALYFRAGRILFGSSNDPRDQLGGHLIQTGKITPEQLEDVTAKVGPGNPLAKALADTGYVSQRELSDAARAKVESILSDVIAYTPGNFEFEDGVLPKGAIDLKLPPERLVLASVRKLTDRNFVLRHLGRPGGRAHAGRGPRGAPARPAADAGGLPEQIDGKRTLKEAAALTRLDEFDAAKVACGLLFLGLVQRAPAGSRASWRRRPSSSWPTTRCSRWARRRGAGPRQHGPGVDRGRARSGAGASPAPRRTARAGRRPGPPPSSLPVAMLAAMAPRAAGARAATLLPSPRNFRRRSSCRRPRRRSRAMAFDAAPEPELSRRTRHPS